MVTNPLGFNAMGTGLVLSLVYLAVVIPLLWVHENVPGAPTDLSSSEHLNLTEAWLDLTEVSNGYHPYNSRRNDVVRDFLLTKIDAILAENKNLSVAYAGASSSFEARILGAGMASNPNLPDVTVFNDMESNVSCSSPGSIGSAGQGIPGVSTYFEGTNLMVYIKGSEDEKVDVWADDEVSVEKRRAKGGVLVNAHYDSVSTGYGATDDGVGVVTVLQLIKYFTAAGNQPKKGIVALFNNGEEDFLNGARAYTQHPMSGFAYTFLNLEGAGAGGRAMLFRSTDTEVTEAYADSPHPFGAVIAGDAFKLGAIRSQTDYVVFEEALGLRGLDVAFWHPRARYHTDQDDARHTSIDSLWHMISTSVATVKSLTSDVSDTFDGPRRDGRNDKARNGRPSEGVWFDLFGKVFLVFNLRGLFAWSLTLAIASPLILIFVCFLLARSGKFYYFSAYPPTQGNGETVSLHGWRGFFRFPIALLISSALTIGSAFLLRKINPLIVYSSLYAVWAMMLTLFFSSFWFIVKGADFVRPSALSRGYALFWLFVIGWAVLVAATVFEDRFGIASGYIFVFYESAIFLATLISFLETSALPSKDSYAKFCARQQDTREAMGAMPDSTSLLAAPEEEDEATENTPLVGGDAPRKPKRSGFANYARSLGASRVEPQDDYDDRYKPFGREQGWSGKLPTWTWILQFLLIGPFVIVIVGQVALILVTSISQTGTDGSSLMAPYTLLAIFTILLLLPVGPFAHRVSYQLPTFLFMIFVGTLLYSLLAFPFSAENRYKAYFLQTVDLETGQNQVVLAGLEEYIRPIIASLPSASGQTITCETRRQREGVKFCSFAGLSPMVVDNVPTGAPPEKGYKDWLKFNVTRKKNTNKARFEVQGQNTRACVLRFDRPIKDFNVHGSSSDSRFAKVPETGSKEIRLWHREWDKPWTVDVEWPATEGRAVGEEGMEGRVVCLWSDDNTEGVIPALDEVRRFAPPWSAVSKLVDGLVEGSKGFVA